jgi:hypothetical protein
VITLEFAMPQQLPASDAEPQQPPVCNTGSALSMQVGLASVTAEANAA